MATPSGTTTEVEQREAEQYWGYLISADRTGTDKFKQLLRGLHNRIGSTFEACESPDLTPAQLARFYRACNGNYDQLFLSTPPSTIAFIYKNLGCFHSLQPLPTPPSEPKYSDPVIPALKVEGWIIWSTIQLLLAPDEHAEFLRQAVSMWDIKVPGTDQVFPKLLPRSCFPPAPDATMQAWYDDMTERLRREMEDEDNSPRIRITDDRPDSPMHRHQKRIRHIPHPYDSDEESLPDSGHDALAYFRNPLFRTVDGRSGVIRRPIKRPLLSPHQSFAQRGKSAAATVGRVVQNVASPHLWDGHPSRQPRDAADHRRRKSLPDRHRHQDDEYAGSSQSSPTGLHGRHHEKHSRRSSHQGDSPAHEHSYWNGGGSHGRQSPELNHRRSHDPSPSPREYFPPRVDGAAAGSRRNSSSSHPAVGSDNVAAAAAAAAAASGSEAGFGPSVSPLFATHVARGETPSYPYRSQSHPADFRSPERAASSRPGSSRPGSGGGSGGREEWEGSDSGSQGHRHHHHHHGRGGSRYNTPVSGADGRRYPVQGDVPYRMR